MDIKSDIMVNIPGFLEQMEKDEQNNSIKFVEPTLAAFRQGNSQQRNQRKFFRNQPGKNQTKTNLYCRMCFKCDLPRAIYTSHNIGDPRCTQMSFQDKQRMKENVKMSSFKDEEKKEDDDDLASQFGYEGDDVQHDGLEELQVGTDLGLQSVITSIKIARRTTWAKGN